MPTTLLIFDALSGRAGALSNPARLEMINGRWVLAFTDIQNDQTLLETVMPQAYSGGALVLQILGFMESATTGDVDFTAEIEAISPLDTVDLDTADSFDSANSSVDNAVPGTAGYLFACSIVLTNRDAVAGGDHLRIRLTRDQASDTATGKYYLYKAYIQES